MAAATSPVKTLTLDDLATTQKPVSVDPEPNHHDDRCGCYCCKPNCLQRLARPVTYLISICCLFLAQSSLIAGYISSIVTNLEKRYDLSTSQISYILSSFDIMAIFAVFLVSYFGDQFNRAHVLGYGALTMAIGAQLYCVPQWLGEPYAGYDGGRGGDSQRNDSSGISDVNICNHTDAAVGPGPLECEDYVSQLWALGVFIAAMLVLSIGSAPVYILGPTYLYDNVHPKNFSLYAGILYSMVALGPAAGFLMGAAVISSYVDPWGDVPPGASEDDREWVGAWWMGFLACSGFLLISAIPLLMFPRSLPGKDWKVDGDDSRPAIPGLGSNLKEMPRKTCALLSNPTFVFATLVMVMEQVVSSGFIAYIAKYFQVSFDMAASRANIITGAVIIPGAVLGMVTGGAVMRRLQLSVLGMARLLLVLGLFPAILVAVLLFLGCKNLSLAGITTGYPQYSPAQDTSPDLLDAYSIYYKDNLTDSCNSHCQCSTATYQPVCGGNDITYFSPCHAGCTELTVYYSDDGLMVRNYSSCACIYESFVHESAVASVATAGKCEQSCSNMYPAMVILFLVVFLTCCGQNPILLITLRCVATDQRSFAMGIQNIIIRLLAQITSPIFFALVFDDACLLWSETCDGRGACLEYDTERLPVVFFGVSLAIKCLSYVCIVGMFFAALWAARRSQEHAISSEDGAGGGDGGGGSRSNGIVAGLNNEAFDPEHTITEDGGGGDGGGDNRNGVVSGHNNEAFRTDQNGRGGVDGGGDHGGNRSNGVVKGCSNAAFRPDDPTTPGTPQSDITVSTILSSYSMATESTQL